MKPIPDKTLSLSFSMYIKMDLHPLFEASKTHPPVDLSARHHKMERLVFTRHLTPKTIIPIIAEILDNTFVPNVLVGDAMLGIMGAFIFPRCLQFVVPDKDIEAAIASLVAAGFPRCNDTNGCRRYSTHFPLAAAHFHLWDDEEAGTTDPGKLCIHNQSDMLWSFPDLPFYISDRNNPYFMTITDDRLPDQPEEKELFGRYPANTYPVRIPTPVKACEAAMLLYCRDQELKLNNAAWEVWLVLLGKYVAGTPLYNTDLGVDEQGREISPYEGFWYEAKCKQNRHWPRYLLRLYDKILQREAVSVMPESACPRIPAVKAFSNQKEKEKDEKKDEKTETEEREEGQEEGENKGEESDSPESSSTPVTPPKDYYSYEKWVM